MIRGVLSKSPRFITIDEAETLHLTSIKQYGGLAGIRDQGLLESALAMPRQGLGGEFNHEYPFEMAAAYMFHICRNHPFVDGNKRTSLACCVVFLRMNGWTLTASEDDIADRVVSVAEGKLDKGELAAWIERNVQARPSIELRDFFQRVDYGTLASMFGSIAAGPIHERAATIHEAGKAVRIIEQANLGALSADHSGDTESAQILRHHAMLLTALVRVAEELGYDWH